MAPGPNLNFQFWVTKKKKKKSRTFWQPLNIYFRFMAPLNNIKKIKNLYNYFIHITGRGSKFWMSKWKFASIFLIYQIFQKFSKYIKVKQLQNFYLDNLHIPNFASLYSQYNDVCEGQIVPFKKKYPIGWRSNLEDDPDRSVSISHADSKRKLRLKFPSSDREILLKQSSSKLRDKVTLPP